MVPGAMAAGAQAAAGKPWGLGVVGLWLGMVGLRLGTVGCELVRPSPESCVRIGVRGLWLFGEGYGS